MKESISYSFLLNIVIVFIFVCAAIIMGIFSYYKAFRANTVIVNAIEKYEGFNCMSQEEAALKLSSIGYNVPFKVNCKSNWGTPCVTDSNDNYAVISYNLDDATVSDSFYALNDQMNSKIYSCENNNNCNSTKRYQYGVYTYMYVDLPIISSVARIPFYSKTREMYEFRDLVKGENGKGEIIAYDINNVPQGFIDQSSDDSAFYNKELASVVLNYSNLLAAGFESDEIIEEKKIEYLFNYETAREKFQALYSAPELGISQYTANIVSSGYHLGCNNTIDYSKY